MALIHEKSVRGRTKLGWLDSYHTFSFGGFHDPNRTGHRALRVINEDVVIPGRTGGEPTYFQVEVDLDSQKNSFIPFAGPDEQEGQAMLRSDTRVHMARVDDGQSVHHEFAPGRAGFLQVVKGIIDIDGNRLSAGDGLQFAETPKFEITAKSEAELMLFDLS